MLADAAAAAAAGHVQYTLHVSDAVVPAILGRGGQVIKEIQEQSGASIKVSQKGDYVPGTSLRIITISGSQVTRRRSALISLFPYFPVPPTPRNLFVVKPSKPLARSLVT
jgi:predicted PilT family ATPase